MHVKPVNRSSLRIALGSICFRLMRRLQWIRSRSRYANKRIMEPYRFCYAEHATPLRRQLSEADRLLQENKITNLRLASQKLNGIILLPGETLSYWKLIGKPTRAKGYREGMLLSQGRVVAGIGGGLCQMSNLIYWMTLHTPLTVTERHRHSYDVFPDSGRTQPFGSGATCYYNYIDLQITNETSSEFQLLISFTETHLHGKWMSSEAPLYTYEVYEKKHWFTQALWGSYFRHNEIYRITRDSEGNCLKDERMAENHAVMMYEPCLPEGIMQG